ncbi:MAG: hypothetical protein K2X46_16685 [Roseomonas sp.]|nr:hypothetical protein [Roseomonas sp.]
MFRVDDPTASATLPVPEAAGTEGYFTEGNPVGSIPSTEFRASWFNRVQESLRAIVDAVGITPAKTAYSAVSQAIRRMAGANASVVTATGALTADQAGIIAVSAAAGNVTLTLPAVNAANGVPLRFNFVRTDTSANTVTIQRAGSNTIEGATSRQLAVNERMLLLGDGVSTWRIAGAVSGRLIGVQVFSSGGTYTPTAGTNSVIVEAVGGGGGGAGAVAAGTGNCAAGTPGNAGSYGKGRFTSAFSGVTVTIGAGGTGGTGANGGNGGTTSFGALLSCPGGPGGPTGIAQPGSASGGNGNPSTAPSGANIVGATGGMGGHSLGFTTGQVALGGGGGASHFGGGASGAAPNINGVNATAPGAGGGGTIGVQNSSAITGGNGAAGIVIVWEFA